MKAISKLALGISLALAGGGLALTPVIAKTKAAKEPSYSYSPDVQKQLAEAQKAIEAKDYATAQAKLATAQPLAKKDDDNYGIGALKLNVGIATSNTAMQSEAIDQILASNKAPADMMPQLLHNQAALALQARNPAKAEAALTRLAQIAPNDADNIVLLAEIKAQNRKPAEALTVLNQAIAAKKASGQPVPEAWYRRALGIAYDAKLSDQALAVSQELVTAYPNANNWRDALTIYRQSTKIDPAMNLDVMRLVRAAGALKGEADYYEYASTALAKGLPGEAKTVIDEGSAARAIDGNKPIFKDVQAMSGGKLTADKASLPRLEKQANASANGKLAAGTAEAYLGYGQYAQAAALYRTALQKGGVDVPAVNTRLGIALARSGDKAGAQQAFAQVTGPRVTIAKFWTIWLNQRG